MPPCSSARHVRGPPRAAKCSCEQYSTHMKCCTRLHRYIVSKTCVQN